MAKAILTDSEIAQLGAELDMSATAEQRRTFWFKNQRSRDKRLCTLAAYAIARNCAESLRLDGEIARAMVYEQHCECYINQLPKGARW